MTYATPRFSHCGAGLVLLTLLAVMASSAASAASRDGIRTDRLLDDREFYRLVACAARPGHACRLPFVKWPAEQAQSLKIGIVRRDASYPSELALAADRALSHAVDEINAVGAAVTLARDAEAPDIRIVLKDLPANARLRGTGLLGMNRGRVNGALVRVWWNRRKEITRAAIVITPVIEADSLTSVMLEETVQALGFVRDVEGAAYAGRSIFAQSDNDTTTLHDQDAMVLRRHYGE